MIQQSSKNKNKFIELKDAPNYYGNPGDLIGINNSQDGLLYVDPDTITGGGGSSYNFTNGITEQIGEDIVLGGNLVQDTSIYSNDKWIDITTTSTESGRNGINLNGTQTDIAGNGIGLNGTALNGTNTNGVHIIGNGTYSDVRISANKLLLDGLNTDNTSSQVLGKDINGFAKWRDINSLSNYTAGNAINFSGTDIEISSKVLTKDISLNGIINTNNISLFGKTNVGSAGIHLYGEHSGDSSGIFLQGNATSSGDDIHIDAFNNKLKISTVSINGRNNSGVVLGRDDTDNQRAKWYYDTIHYGDEFRKEINLSTTTSSNTVIFDISSAGLTQIQNIQVSAYLQNATTTNAPIAIITSVNTTSITVSLFESKTTEVLVLNTNVEGLETHAVANTIVYLTVKGI